MKVIVLAAVLGCLLSLVAGISEAADAKLCWTPPTQNTDGTALTDLAGYRIYAGCTASGSYEFEPVTINDPNEICYLYEGLPGSSNCFFAATAFNESGVESSFSNEAAKTTATEPLPGPVENLSVTVEESPDELIISNLSRPYPVVQLAPGALVYTDRSYTFTNLSGFEGLLQLQTANDDKTGTDDPWLTFTINRTATVYVGFDVRHPAPAWLSDWHDTGLVVETTDTDFRMYAKTFANAVSLGPNALSGDASMYVVAVE